MRRFSGTQFAVVALVVCTLVGSACAGDDADRLIAGDGDSVASGATGSPSSAPEAPQDPTLAFGDDDTEDDSAEDETAETPGSGQDGTAQTSTTAPSTNTPTTVAEAAANSATPTTATPSTTTVTPADVASIELETLGESGLVTANGIGVWAVDRTDPNPDPDNECRPGTLVFMENDVVVHRYDELSFNGGIRLFSGTRGMDAFVVNCEETVASIWLQGSALLPEAGYPEIDRIDLVDVANEPWFAYLADWGWRDGLFAGYGWFGDTYDLWAFDIPEDGATPLADVIGTRQAVNDDLGASIVVPHGWSYESTEDYEVVQHPHSFTYVQVSVLPTGAPAPLPEGDEFLGESQTTSYTWLQANDILVAQQTPATTYDFLNEDGIRSVRHVPLQDRTVVIEVFQDAGDGSVDQALPWLVLDVTRVFE